MAPSTPLALGSYVPVLILVLVALDFARADPETVEGLYLTKKSVGPPKQRQRVLPPAVGSKERSAPWKSAKTDLKYFPQARFGHASGQKHAFANYLPKPKVMASQQQAVANNWLYGANHLGLHKPPQAYKQPQPAKPLYTRPQQRLSGTFRPRLLTLKTTRRPQTATAAPPQAPTPARVRQSVPAVNLNTVGDERQLKGLVLSRHQQATVAHNEKPQEDTTAVNTSAEEAEETTEESKLSVQKKEVPPVKESEVKKSAIEPRAGFLKGNAFEGVEGSSEGVFSGDDRHKAILGLIIGIAFVAVFVAMGIGLATQCAMDRMRQMRTMQTVFSAIRTPNDDDCTPPELRGHPTFVQPGAGGGEEANCGMGSVGSKRKGSKSANGGQSFFTGKLILHEANKAAPTNGVPKVLDGGDHMTNSLLAAQSAVLMPSPAEQVTNDLVSPKYETEDDEDDDTDDTVYECVGYGAGGRLVVANPFYLQGESLPHLQEGVGAEPKPISSQSSIFHHGIKGFN